MSGKQHKRELKRQREAARQAARREERKRTYITLGVIAAVVAVGGAIVWLTVSEERRIAFEQQQEAEELLSESQARASEQAAALEDRPVACEAEAPPAAGEEKPTFEEPEQVLEEGVDYRAVVETSCGTVTIDLAEDRAPETVNSFVFLAQQGFFDGLEIFRNAASIGALQTGAGTNENSFSIGYTLPDELAFAEEEGYPAGAVAMANAGPNTGGSQFFFVYNDQFDAAFAENRAYTRFGTVTEGLDVLQQIGAIETAGPPEPGGQPTAPAELVYLEQVTIETGAGGGAGGQPAGTEGEQGEPTETATE